VWQLKNKGLPIVPIFGILGKANFDRRWDYEKFLQFEMPAFPILPIGQYCRLNYHAFRRRWGQWVRRLGITKTSEVSVLADGAAWILDAAASELCGAEGVLDIYHSERLYYARRLSEGRSIGSD
jgi:hypothetical protein